MATAKKLVYGEVNVDSIAGPSEILVLADETANPVYVAADLLSQAEHDELAGSVLITTSQTLAERVAEEIEKQTARAPRREIIEAALATRGMLIVVSTLEEGIRSCRGFITRGRSSSGLTARSPWEITWRARTPCCPRAGRPDFSRP